MKPHPLGQIQNQEGWKFIGVDKWSREHACIVRRDSEGFYYMSCNTVLFGDLVGFFPDKQTDPLP